MTREIPPAIGRGEAGKSARPIRAVAAYSMAPNKPNFPLFRPENEGRSENQSQFGRLSHGRSRSNPTSPESETQNPRQTQKPKDPYTRNAPNKANLCPVWPGNEVWPEKQTQFAGEIGAVAVSKYDQRPSWLTREAAWQFQMRLDSGTIAVSSDAPATVRRGIWAVLR